MSAENRLVMSGSLLKLSRSSFMRALNKWYERQFQLDSNKILRYSVLGKRNEFKSITLSFSTVITDISTDDPDNIPSKQFVFEIKDVQPPLTKGERFLIAASSQEQKVSWIEELKKVSRL
jgi:hypothetical protein